jgi:2-polyprenyl-6-methoxyphenol hydroxylase-like FAD-dependent oxidoreductase
VRLEDDRLDLACAVDGRAVRSFGGPGALVQQLLREVGWPLPAGLAEQPWRGTAALTRQATRVAGQRLFALGDATGYVEPFTGEGMAWALASAVALAPLVLRGVQRWEDALAREWTIQHRLVVRDRQIACRLLAAVLRVPWLTAALVALLRSPLRCFAGPVIRYLNRPDRGVPTTGWRPHHGLVTRSPRAGDPPRAIGPHHGLVTPTTGH